MTSTLSYNKDQLLNYYRASCPEIQEPPENLKQFPLILSTKLLQPVNETNLHLFDSDYNINPESTFPTLSTRGRGRGGRGGSRRGGGLASSGRGSSISPLVTSMGGSPSGTSSLFGTSPTSLGRAGTPIGSGPRAIARSPLSLGGARLPAWAIDEELTQTDSSLTGLNNNSNSLLSNNSFFGNSTSNSSLDDDTFGPGALQPQTSIYQPMVSLESLAAATMKMNEHWKTQMGKKPIDDFDDSLEPQGLNDDDGSVGAIDWDSQWYYLSEDNEPKGPYSLNKLKEWMDLFYLQSDTRIKQDIESNSTTSLGEVLNSLTQQNNNHMPHGMGNNILASQHLLSNNGLKGNMHSNDFFMNDKPSIPTGSILGSLSDPFMSSQSIVKSPIQGSLLSSLDKTQQPTPITPTTQQFSHPWGFGQQPMMHPGYPFVNPNMPNHHFMPPFHQGPGHWGNMPTNLDMNMGASNNNNNSNSIPSVTDIENELLYVQPTIPTHQEVFQHYTPVQPVSNVQEHMIVEEQEPIVDEEENVTEQVIETVEEETIPQKEEIITQETPKVDDKSSKKDKNKKKGAEAKPATPSKKKQELPPVKEEPVFKSVPPTETVSFAEPKKEEVKGWGVQSAVTTAPVQTLKQIMEQQKKEALKQSKETQQKKKEAAEQVIKVNTANPWGVANAATVVAPSLKEIQEEEAKKKKQKAQKQQQTQNQASIVKNATATWGGSALQFKAIPEKDVPSTSSTSAQFGAVIPKTVETKSFQFQAVKPQTTPATTSSTSPKEEEEDQEEGVFWDYSPTPATATATPSITTASEKKNSKKDKKKKATNEKPTTTTQTTTSITTPSNTAVEEDFPSISAKNNPFGQADVSQEFKDWFKKGLKKLNKSVDPSFMYFLLSLNSEKETIDYMSEYIGNSSAAQKFAQEFIANKSFESPNQGANKKKK